MPGTAIFDMDRTLTRTGTWSRYMFQVNRGRLSFYLRLPLLGLHAVAYKLRLCSRLSVKEHGLKTLTWASRAELERAAEAFADAEIENGLRQQTRSVLEKHRTAGDELVMATAAADLVARPIAERLGFQRVISTALDWTEDGHLSGRLAGPNCYGEAKLELVLKAEQTGPFAHPITAYSDHVSDQPFLAWADRGVAVNPSSGLRAIAGPEGFDIEDWDK